MKGRPLHILTAIIAVLISSPAFAEGGSNSGYSPYSKFGIGALNKPGTAYNRTMGGVGIAARDHRYINTLNPASVTARDSLSFMLDFNINESSVFLRQGDMSSIGNTFNVNGFNMSFPIWRSSAFMIGIAPFSSLGYDFADKVEGEENYNVIGQVGNINDAYTGTGSLYQLYFGAGVTFWKRLSLGAQFTYYFGSLEKGYTRNFEATNYRSIYSGSQMRLKGFGGKLGVQYEQPLGKDKITIGGTYRIQTTVQGDAKALTYAVQSSVADTLSCQKVDFTDVGVNIPQEFSAGISYRHGNRWCVEFDYTYSDWRRSGMDVVTGFKAKGFSATETHSYNLGFEITPNRDDVRYYMKKVSYRLGGYFNNDYYLYNGHRVDSMGVTLGMTFPVFRWLNGITVGLDLGQRGSLADNMIRERYINVSVAFNIYDIWFVKNQYK